VNQMVARLLLNKLGYTPDFVLNGREALAAIERQTYDLVFMDIHMPVMDGLSATREICQRFAPGQRPRVIGMTASASVGDRRDAAAAGMDDYVPKPITVEAVVAALRRTPRRDLTMPDSIQA
jgi:CheY-like chemotaxis protein